MKMSYPLDISGICQQLGRNRSRNRIVKMAGYPANRNRISGIPISNAHNNDNEKTAAAAFLSAKNKFSDKMDGITHTRDLQACSV